MIFSWLNKKIADDEKARAEGRQPQSTLSWVQDQAKAVNEVGAKGVDMFFGGVKNLAETASLIPKELTLRNDLKSGKISKDEYNAKLQAEYDKQPFFKLEKGKSGLLQQKQMDPLEFLGQFSKGGLDAGLEIAPGIKSTQVAIGAGTKFKDVAAPLLKQGSTYAALGNVNSLAEDSQLTPEETAMNVAGGIGGSAAAYPLTKGALRVVDAIKSKAGKSTTAEAAQAVDVPKQDINEADLAVPAFIRRAQGDKIPAEPVDSTDIGLPAFVRRTREEPNPLDEAMGGSQTMAQDVTPPPTEKLTTELTLPTKPVEKAMAAVAPKEPDALEITAKLPEKVAKAPDGDLATPDELLGTTRTQAAKQLQTAQSKLAKEQANLETLTPNTSAYQKAQRNIEQYTKDVEAASATYAKTSQARSMDELVSEQVPDVKKKANIVDFLRTPERVLQKIGLGEESKFLRASYENYQKELPEEINKVSQWANQLDSEGNQRVFQFLDGKKVDLTPAEQKIADEARIYLKDWAKRLGLPEDKQISNYITHIFEKDFIKKEFDPDIARLIQNKVPGSVYNPFLQKRLGQLGYKEDFVDAMDAYVKRAVRTVNMNPALERISDAAESLDQDSYKFVKKMIDRVNMRPTDTENFIDNLIKSSPIGYKLGGRPSAAISRNTRQMIYRATLGLSPSSAIRNLTQGANTYAKLGEKYTIVGYTKMLQGLVTRSKELDEVGVMGNDFVQDRTISASKQALQKVDKGLFAFFDLAERINRGSAYYGAKAKALAKGASEDEAIETAKKLVRETQFNYGAIDTPVAMNTAVSKLLAQYQSYNIKQGEFIGNLIKEKDFAGILRLAAASTIFLYTVGKLVGMEPKDFIPGSRMSDSGVAGGLVGPLFGVADAGIKSKDAYGNELSPGERVGTFADKAFTTLFPGGTQIKRMVQGAGTASEGEATDSQGRTKYTVGPEDAVRAVLFGPNSLPQAKEYYRNKAGAGSKSSKTKSRRSSKVER